MAAGNWASVLGAALGAGSQTFQQLSEQERIQRERDAARALEAQRFEAQQQQQQRQFELQQKQFESGEKDRKFRQIQAALEHSDPGQIFSQEFVNDASEFGFGGRFEQKPTMTGVQNLPGIGFGGIALPQVEQQLARKATADETAVLEDRNHVKKQREQTEAFRAHLQTPEHLKESYDAQVAEAFSHGVNNLPMSSTEFDRRQSVEHKNRLSEIGAQNAGRIGAAGRGPGAQWLAGYNQIEDNVRQKYSAQLNALARAAADGTNPEAQPMLDALTQRIQSEAETLATRLLGPMPGQAAQGGGDTGGDPIEQFFTDNADEISSNPRGVIEEVKNSSLPVEAKKAILARLMANGRVGAEAPAGPGVHPLARLGNAVTGVAQSGNDLLQRGYAAEPDMNQILAWLKEKLANPQSLMIQPQHPSLTPSQRLRPDLAR